MHCIVKHHRPSGCIHEEQTFILLFPCCIDVNLLSPPLTSPRTKYDSQQQALTDRIVAARVLLKQQDVPYDFRVKISQICSDLNVDGIRGDIVTNRAAKVRRGRRVQGAPRRYCHQPSSQGRGQITSGEREWEW